jgi:polyhydroxybutyrate depolymerase
MVPKKYFVIALAVIIAIMLPLGSSVPVAADPISQGPSSSSPGLHSGWMVETSSVNASWVFNRTFEYYIPTSYDGSEEVALLFSFCGLGSNGDEQRDLTKFDVLAEQQGFIAVFPSSTNLDPNDPRWSALNLTLPDLTGSNIMWNCGTINGTPIAPLQYVAGVNDTEFVADMISWFESSYNINTSEIYSTGMSNGAMFSYYLAFNLPGMFAAIAPVCAPMPLNLGVNAGTTPPAMTVIVIRGSSDPIIPEPGQPGLIEDNFSFNTSATIAYWCGIDGINMASPGPETTTWEATTSDSTSVTRYVYGPGTDGTQVILFWVTGGGHQWPGATPYLASILGAVTTHVDGTAQIWKYLPPEKYCLTTYTSIGGSVATPGQETFANDTFDGSTMFSDAGISPTVVNLEATPDSSSWEFVNWTGDVSTVADVNAATTTVTVQPNTDYEITGNFQLKSTPTPPTAGCFIATAAYGTPTAKQLDVLRAFRDDVLLKSTVGARLVDFYYRTSPPVANFISRHEILRTLTRDLLINPIVWIVRATVSIWHS